MSDLQCAATLLFVVPGDEQRARALAASLRERRCSALYAGETSAAADTGRTIADILGLPVRPESRLHEQVDEEQEADAVARVCGLLGEIADEYRGETVVVVAPARLLERALPTLAQNVPAMYGQHRPLAAGATAEMKVDADGWVLGSWAGERPGG